MNENLLLLVRRLKVPDQAIAAIDEQASHLSPRRVDALVRALTFELEGGDGFSLRGSHERDLYQFDRPVNALLSRIIAHRHPARSDVYVRPSLFERDRAVEQEETAVMAKNGYVVSSHMLPVQQIEQVKCALGKFAFRTNDGQNVESLGSELLARVSPADGRAASMGSNTYWLKDQNGTSRDPTLLQLAFDPYILSIVAKHLGCFPIHVQTNFWFSFANSSAYSQLTSSAQLYHQDKEFVNFVKVFIYLSDVGPENGPHCYVEGSHIDELLTFGVPLSTRVSDADIGKYYSRDRLRFTGPAGTIVFGNTCAAHKGAEVRSGHRLMLQFEYASSLYLSPVQPFETLPLSFSSDLSPNELTRLTQNYDTPSRQRFAAAAGQKRSLLLRLVDKVVRRARDNFV